WILFVDGGSKHADGADEELAVLLRGFFEALNVLLDVACHQVEVLSEFADFGGPANRRALVEFTAADGARGSGQAANGSADAYGKEIAEQNGEQNDHGNESQRLAVQLGDPGIGARLVDAALRDNRPVDLREGAVRPHHFDGAVI